MEPPILGGLSEGGVCSVPDNRGAAYRLVVWFDSTGGPLQWSVDHYDHGERIGTVVTGTGPFDNLHDVADVAMRTVERLGVQLLMF